MDLKKLGKICKQYRIDNGISIIDIAKLCNYTPWNIYKFERGDCDTIAILLAYMAYGLDIERGELWQVLTNC